MALYIEDGSNRLPIAELGVLGSKQQVILGALERDLILRTAGTIKIQAGNKYYDFPFSTDSNDNSISSSELTILASTTELTSTNYPGDGKFVYVTSNKGFYITDNNTFIPVYIPPVAGSTPLYLSYNTSQQLTGEQKLQVELNTGNLLNKLADVSQYSLTDVYPGMFVYAIQEAKHYKLITPSDPGAISSWVPVYFDGNTTNALTLGAQYAFNRLTSPVSTDPILSIGSTDYSVGVAQWVNDGNTYWQSLALNSLKGYTFLTKDTSGLINTTLQIFDRKVGINTLDLAYNFTVDGLNKIL